MKKLFFIALLLVSSITASYANPGDTTWVQANNVQLNYYNNFDTTIAFPDGSVSYRKIYMIFTLGEYACAAGTQYCHQWDYTVQNYLMTPGGDTIELTRFITPFATSGTPGFPDTWTHRYVFDVTDFYPLLKDTATIRIHYSGYSGGFTANVKFAFVEGMPERNVTGIQKLWDGSYAYGNAANPIDNHITGKSLLAPAGTAAAEMHMLITGHGADNQQLCCEFDSHGYFVTVNSDTVDQHTIWRDNCGSNELYPQGGTWLYDRGGWCPGADVAFIHHKLTGVTAGSAFTTDVNFDAYTDTASGGNGSYTISAEAVYYGGINHTVDASLEDIISPTDNEAHFRENPSSIPILNVRNSGSTPITSIVFNYGVKDSALSQYTWTGSIAPLTTQEITLPELHSIIQMSMDSLSGRYQFIAYMGNVNGAADNDATNDTLRSAFVVAPSWPATFVVALNTNNEGINGNSESSWTITDIAGNVVASRLSSNISQQYFDTVATPAPGYYKLTVTDSGCDGLHWWVFDQDPSQGVTAGNFYVKKLGSITKIPVHGNTYTGLYHDDFGCGFVQYFTVTAPSSTGISAVAAQPLAMEVFPNPAANNFNVALYGAGTANGQLTIMDMTGKVILTQNADNANTRINTALYPSGLYNILYTAKNGAQAHTRIVITH